MPEGLAPIDEGGLLASLSRGDRTAGERLVEATYRQVYGALHRLCGGDAELAADLTQETYRKAWQALSRFDGRSQLSTWLYRIAYTTWCNHLRRPRLLPGPDAEWVAAVPDPAPGPAERAVAEDEARRLRRAVSALPDELRFTVTARYWVGLPVREIARSEGVTPMAIRKRLARALRLLRQSCEEDTP
ncbi:MAG TPA: sigma-70 family RNA polymerase sigma factor [Thermoanaerobaculia bacterium]|nr:sigma-70 family RNA polymerase sigma factor [Thermoanaerobaculia bacterium]